MEEFLEDNEGETREESASSNEMSESEEVEESQTITPTEAFEKLLTPDIASYVLEERNEYGEQYVEAHTTYMASHPMTRAHGFLHAKFMPCRNL